MLEIRTKILLIIITVLSFMLSSCVVKYSTTGASIPMEMKTVSVLYFNNRSNNVQPQFSQEFTQKLRDKIKQNTSLKMVTEGGDAIFEGEITGYDVQPTAIQGNNAAKNRFTVTIKVKFTNEIDPKLSYDASFSRFRDYNSEVSFESGTNANLPDIINELTEDIFNKAFVNW